MAIVEVGLVNTSENDRTQVIETPFVAGRQRAGQPGPFAVCESASEQSNFVIDLNDDPLLSLRKLVIADHFDNNFSRTHFSVDQNDDGYVVIKNLHSHGALYVEGETRALSPGKSFTFWNSAVLTVNALTLSLVVVDNRGRSPPMDPNTAEEPETALPQNRPQLPPPQQPYRPTGGSGEHQSPQAIADWCGATRLNVAIVFSDIVGSTALNLEVGDQEMKEIRRAHFQRAKQLITALDGCRVKTLGDGVLAIFRTADNALDYALAMGRDSGHPLVKARFGIHCGQVEVEPGEHDVQGSSISFAARVMGECRGPGVWISDRTKEDIEGQGSPAHEDLSWIPHVRESLKGFEGRKRILWELSRV